MPTTNEAIEVAKKIFNEQCEYFGYLKDRWLDEHEYEDFQEYIDEMKKKLEAYEGVKLIKFTKRPFAVVFEVYDVKKFVMKISGNRILINVFN